MTSKFLRIFLAVAAFFAISALAQTSSAATPSGSPAAPANTPAPIVLTGTRVGTININDAIFGTNEGSRDLQNLGKKFEPKQNELKSQSDELEALKKQLSAQGEKLNPDALETLRKQIESKQKLFDRNVQDAQEDFRGQQQEIMGRILHTMGPMILKYAQDNGYGLILDSSNVWPQSPIVVAGEGVDITKAVIDVYNAQSGVPAPTSSGAAKPAGPKPTTGAGTAKPPAPKPSDTKQ